MILLVLLAVLTAVLGYFFLFTDNRDCLPPMASGRLPIVGHSLAFFRDPKKLICDNNIRNNGIFMLQLANRQVVLICDPKLKSTFYSAQEDTLSHAAALRSFGFTIALGEDSNALNEVMHTKLLKVNIINNVNRYVDDFARLTEKVVREEILKSSGTIKDIFDFSKGVALRAMTSYYIGNVDIDTLAPDFIENYRKRGSKSFGFGLVANVVAGPLIGRLAQRPAKSDRSALVDQMEEIIDKVLKMESESKHSSAREPYLTHFFHHVSEKAREAGHEEVKNRDLADFAVSQIGSGAGGPTVLFAQLLLFLIDSPRRSQYLETLRKEIDAESGNTGYFQSHSTFLHNCILEALRLISHTLGSMRLAIKAWNIGEFVIPAGTFVGVSHVANCYDPRIFANPDEFVPERWDSLDAAGMEKMGVFTPFSGGFHRCPGHRFGKMLVAMLFTSFFKIVDMESVALIENLPPVAWKQQALAGRAAETGITFKVAV